MLTVPEALAAILAEVRPVPTEVVDLDAALGRVLGQALVSAGDLPPFDNSAMDGFAVRLTDLTEATPSAPVTLPVQAIIRAAPGAPEPLEAGQVAQIMTGAPLPAGAEAVVPVEQTTRTATGEVSFTGCPRAGANCRPAGSDIAAGEVAIRAGVTLGPAEIAMLAAVGENPVTVARRPRAIVISTGDELVPAGTVPGPGQLRDSSIHALPAQLRAAGAEVVAATHAIDSEAEFAALLAKLPPANLVVCTGGVSMGDRDFVRPVFERLGRRIFWRVAVKPGKPLLFGTLGEALFFGLPGNPVSSMVTCDLFVVPALEALMGRRDGGRVRVTGHLEHGLRSDPDREEYVRVTVREADGRLLARFIGSQSSGRLASMVGAMGYAVLPIGVGEVTAGEPVQLELAVPRVAGTW